MPAKESISVFVARRGDAHSSPTQNLSTKKLWQLTDNLMV
jgi:hypothetical protein